MSKGRLVDSGLNAALGVREPRRSNVRAVSGGVGAREGGRGVELLGYDGHSNGSGRPTAWDEPAQAMSSPGPSVSIMGASRGVTWVRVENLAQGTTTTDVIVSAGRIAGSDCERRWSGKLRSEWTTLWETLRSRNPRRGHSDSNVALTTVLLCHLCSLRSSHSTI